MSSPGLALSSLILSMLALLPGCTEKMQLGFDRAWERVDPLGHRSEHQMRSYPRGYNPGITLPGDYKLSR